MAYDGPVEGANGPVPLEPVPIGKAIARREGTDITMAGVGVSVHRALEAADTLAQRGISAEVLDLRTVSPLDRETLCGSVSKTGGLLVVDEDYREFGLSGELAASVLEAGISAKYSRICTEQTIPYCREEEDCTLPNTARIVKAALRLLK